jgi:hypothetical protein
MGPTIGAISSLPGRGGQGVVVGVHALGRPDNGRQLAALQIKASAPVRDGAAGGGVSGAPGTPVGPPAGPLAAAPTAGGSGQNDAAGSRDSSIGRLSAELTPAEKAAVTRLQQRDQQVRQEEKIHAAIAGDLCGAISYTFQRGPDGRQYAVGGSVGIRAVTRSGDPAEASNIAGRLAAAAVAPTNPSAQDYATARRAYGMLAENGEAAAPGGRRAGRTHDVVG